MVDISNPTNPTQVGLYNTSGEARGVHVSGNIAYIADGEAGLQVVDVSNPISLSKISAYNTPGYAWDVYILGEIHF